MADRMNAIEKKVDALAQRMNAVAQKGNRILELLLAIKNTTAPPLPGGSIQQ